MTWRKMVLQFVAIALFGGVSVAAEKIEQVSIINLIATPTQFAGKLVGVYGFLRMGEEQSAIYLSADDAEIGNHKNGIWVDVLPSVGNIEKLSGHYVFVVGSFDASDQGHLNAYSGTLKQVSKVREKK